VFEAIAAALDPAADVFQFSAGVALGREQAAERDRAKAHRAKEFAELARFFSTGRFATVDCD